MKKDTLSELLQKVTEKHKNFRLSRDQYDWYAGLNMDSLSIEAHGFTPEEAVATLVEELIKRKIEL